MAKRNADKELTDRNWDQEEEGEEAGTFSIASDDVLKNRPIKKAKRRNVGSECDTGSFTGFKGFSLTPSTANAGSFSGFGNGNSLKKFGGFTNGNGMASFGNLSVPPASTATAAFNGSTSSSVSADIATKQTNGSIPSSAQSTVSSSSNKEYSRQLTALNCSVRDWITKHVNNNPLCDLNPIFKDYEQHLASIEKKYGTGASDDSSEEKASAPAPPTTSFSSSSSSSTPALFSFGKGSDESQNKTATTSLVPSNVTFNFGQKVDSTVLSSFSSKSATPSFSFSSGNSSAQSPLFGATNSQPTMSFAAPKTENTPQTDENGDEETEEPPKPEVNEVKEEDAFYSKKCKMFYKKDSEFKEKGVGTLHLKQSGEDKTQMIIRADTNLGNILLNIILQSSIPCSRVGKNNVMLVCVPNPGIDDKNPNTPIPLLIRVKTEEDANELLKILEEKKG